MAIDPGCNAKIKYTGDGVQTDFTYPFTTIEDTDLYVAVWDDTTEEYNNVTNWTKDGGLVRFDTAPDAGVKFIIYRLTEIDPMKAIFHPGHPVKASDLNDNFEQLQSAIEDGRCLLELQEDKSDERYWRKSNETIYTNDEWISSDGYVATTGAIDSVIDEILEKEVPHVTVSPNPPLNPNQGDLWWSTIEANLFIWYEDVDSKQWVDASVTDVNLDPIWDDISDLRDLIAVLEANKVDKSAIITRENQIQLNGEWLTNDDNIASTSALSERYDVIILPEGESTPKENEEYPYIQPGKFLITSDNNLYAWNGDTWFQPIAGGGGGGGGGSHTQIKTTNPITQNYDAVNNTYSLFFDISSLNAAPAISRTRRIN